jgi:hypothetical protein
VAAATVVFSDGGAVPATLGADGRWHTAASLPIGATATVERGGIVDTFGELNGAPASVTRAASPSSPAATSRSLPATGWPLPALAGFLLLLAALTRGAATTAR